MVQADCSGGRFLYLRDNDTHQFWAPTWQPPRHALEDKVTVELPILNCDAHAPLGLRLSCGPRCGLKHQHLCDRSNVGRFIVRLKQVQTRHLHSLAPPAGAGVRAVQV